MPSAFPYNNFNMLYQSFDYIQKMYSNDYSATH